MACFHEHGICWHSNFWILLPKFGAITLFGCVFTRKKNDVLKRYLTTFGAQIVGMHERWHILQSKDFKTRWLGFYTYYLYYWVRNLFKDPKHAYKKIPFEAEAYDMADGKRIDPEGKTSNWKSYI